MALLPSPVPPAHPKAPVSVRVTRAARCSGWSLPACPEMMGYGGEIIGEASEPWGGHRGHRPPHPGRSVPRCYPQFGTERGKGKSPLLKQLLVHCDSVLGRKRLHPAVAKSDRGILLLAERGSLCMAGVTGTFLPRPAPRCSSFSCSAPAEPGVRTPEHPWEREMPPRMLCPSPQGWEGGSSSARLHPSFLLRNGRFWGSRDPFRGAGAAAVPARPSRAVLMLLWCPGPAATCREGENCPLSLLFCPIWGPQRGQRCLWVISLHRVRFASCAPV